MLDFDEIKHKFVELIDALLFVLDQSEFEYVKAVLVVVGLVVGGVFGTLHHELTLFYLVLVYTQCLFLFGDSPFNMLQVIFV